MYVYSCDALSARFFAVDQALNSNFMIMIMTTFNFIMPLWYFSYVDLVLPYVCIIN